VHAYVCVHAHAHAHRHTHTSPSVHTRALALSRLEVNRNARAPVRTEQAACTTPTKVCSGHARPHNNALEEGATYHRAMARLGHLGALASIRGRRLGGLRGLTRLGRGCAPHATGDHPRLTAVLGFRFDYEESWTKKHTLSSCKLIGKSSGRRHFHDAPPYSRTVKRLPDVRAALRAQGAAQRRLTERAAA